MSSHIRTVTQELNDARNHFRGAVIPPEILEILDNETTMTMDSQILTSALKVGAIAPDFVLPNVSGDSIQLYELLGNGPVVITFYRGGWCPYCSIALRGLQRELKEFKALGAELVAISPELPDNSLTTAEKNGIEFQVLTDTGNKVAATFGVAVSVSKEVQEVYRGFGNSLDLINGVSGAESLPAPSTFVIGKDKIVRLAFVDADYTKRLDPLDALKALRSLASESVG